MADRLSDQIAIVDDTPPLGELIAEPFRMAGFRNIEVFEDPNFALKELKRGPRPAVVISDYDMPGMDGVSFLTELEKFHPDFTGIIVTGCPERVHSRYEVIAKEGRFLETLFPIVIRALKGQLVPLVACCPFGEAVADCAFHSIRVSSRVGLAAWLAGMGPQEIHMLIRAHEACLLARTKETAESLNTRERA